VPISLLPAFHSFFQVPYPVSPLLATLTKTAGVYTLSSQNETWERTLLPHTSALGVGLILLFSHLLFSESVWCILVQNAV